jgi:hypothetical protein
VAAVIRARTRTSAGTATEAAVGGTISAAVESIAVAAVASIVMPAVASIVMPAVASIAVAVAAVRGPLRSEAQAAAPTAAARRGTAAAGDPAAGAPAPEGDRQVVGGAVVGVRPLETAMDTRKLMRSAWRLLVLASGVGVLWSCQTSSDLAGSQETFSSPEEAVGELLSVLRADDLPRLRAIFGPEGAELVDSGDPIDDRNRRREFLELCDEGKTIEMEGDETAILYVGPEEWPFPVPIVKAGASWYFDAIEGAEEILDRRIGRNELYTIQVCLAVADAQDEYYEKDRDGDGVLEYAQAFWSSEGERDGLYWPTAEGEELSPVGELVAAAARDQYRRRESASGDTERMPFHGYYFAPLRAQGDDAPGGAYEYLAGDHMIGGWAMVAWPAEYGNSGVKTFMVNQTGVVYESDLGEQTAEKAAAITVFNPGPSWAPVPEAALRR